MLLKQLIEAPVTSSNLLVYDAFRQLDRDSIAKEVIGLANADVEGPRHILFGVNPNALNDNPLVGIDEKAVRNLKRAHRLVSKMVEPGLDLAFVFDKINGKLVGALEIDGCEFGPYIVAEDWSEELTRGACWVRRERELLRIPREDLQSSAPPPAAVEPERETLPDDIDIQVGFNNEPGCDYVEVDVPDTSDPPFNDPAANDADGSLNITQTLKVKVSTMTAQVMNITRKNAESGATSDDTDDIGAQITEAVRKHFYLEERAVKVNICTRNDCGVDLENLTFTIGFPSMPGFAVAHRIYSSPFDKRAAAGRGKLEYPEVEFHEGGAIATAKIAELPAGSTQSVLGTPLRLAVGKEALGRKIAMPYVLRTADGRQIATGRLKMRLGQLAASKTEFDGSKTLVPNLERA